MKENFENSRICGRSSEDRMWENSTLMNHLIGQKIAITSKKSTDDQK